MADQIQATEFSFAMYEDTTFGTSSSGHGVLIPVVMVDLAMDQNLARSNVITASRNRTRPSQDNKSVTKGFKTQPDSRSFGWLMKHHLGVPYGLISTVNVTAGGSGYSGTVNVIAGGHNVGVAVLTGDAVTGITLTNPQTWTFTTLPTLTFSAGGTGATAVVTLMDWVFTNGALPIGPTFEKRFNTTGSYFQYPTARLDQMQVTIGTGGLFEATFQQIGTKEITANSPLQASPNAYPVVAFAYAAPTLQILKGSVGGSLVASAITTKFDWTGKNNLTPTRVIGGAGVIAQSPAMQYDFAFQSDIMFTDMTEYNLAAAGTPRALRLVMPSDTPNHQIKWDFEEVMMTLSSVPIQNAGGVSVTLNGEGYVQSGAHASTVVCTITNDVPTYATIP